MLAVFLAALESKGDKKICLSFYEQCHIPMERFALKLLGNQIAAAGAKGNTTQYTYDAAVLFPCEIGNAVI